MRPRPQWGQGWRKGGDYHLKRGFLQRKKYSANYGLILVALKSHQDPHGNPMHLLRGKCVELGEWWGDSFNDAVHFPEGLIGNDGLDPIEDGLLIDPATLQKRDDIDHFHVASCDREELQAISKFRIEMGLKTERFFGNPDPDKDIFLVNDLVLEEDLADIGRKILDISDEIEGSPPNLV